MLLLKPCHHIRVCRYTAVMGNHFTLGIDANEISTRAGATQHCSPRGFLPELCLLHHSGQTYTVTTDIKSRKVPTLPRCQHVGCSKDQGISREAPSEDAVRCNVA